MPRTITIVLIASVFLIPRLSIAQDEVTPIWEDWRGVELIQPGRHVTVERFPGLGAKVTGAFVSAVSDSIVVATKDGQIALAKSEVRTVKGRRGKTRRAHWIGLGAGFALGALLAAGEGDFEQPSASFIFGAAGAGLGYLGGLGVRAIGQKALIYRAPKKATGT